MFSGAFLKQLAEHHHFRGKLHSWLDMLDATPRTFLVVEKRESWLLVRQPETACSQGLIHCLRVLNGLGVPAALRRCSRIILCKSLSLMVRLDQSPLVGKMSNDDATPAMDDKSKPFQTLTKGLPCVCAKKMLTCCKLEQASCFRWFSQYGLASAWVSVLAS